MRLVFTLVLIVLVLAACGGAVGSPGASSTLPPEARGALEQVFVDGHAYTLQVDLYRDLMPGPAPTPKRGVAGTIFLKPDTASDAPQGIRSGRPGWSTAPRCGRPCRSRSKRSRWIVSVTFR